MEKTLRSKDSSFGSQLKANREEYRLFCRSLSTLPLYLDSRWLDTICGQDGWSVALGHAPDGSISFALPFQIGCKARFFRKLHTPLFTPYVGPFLVKNPELTAVHSFLHWYETMVQMAMQFVKPIRFIQWKLHYSVPHDLPFRWVGMHNRPRVTYLIRPGYTPEQHVAGMDKNIIRDIRQAQKKYLINKPPDRDRFVDLAIRHLEERQVSGTAAYRQALTRILTEYRNDQTLKFMIAVDDQGRIAAGAVFVADSATVYYLIGFRDASLSNNQGNSLLLWEGISWALDTRRTFDFEGSSIPGVADYFRRFGGEQQLCIEVVRP